MTLQDELYVLADRLVYAAGEHRAARIASLTVDRLDPAAVTAAAAAQEEAHAAERRALAALRDAIGRVWM